MTTPTLDAFTAELEALRARLTDQAVLVEAVGNRLGSLIESTDWLPPAARMPCEDGYAQHLLYASDDGGLSVCSLVWKPGQRTAIHDHVAWCVVGVCEGCERERRFRLEEGPDGSYLVETAVRDARAGEVAGCVADGADIHSVANAGDCVAVSIHVYGADLRTTSSSILHRFDDLPVRHAEVSRP